MKQQLLKLARDIIDLCDKISGNGTSPNTDVIGLIKREFEEQCDSLEKENKVKVLNHKRELWADSKLHIRKWDFVIVHKDGILIKRILDHNVEEGTITIHSLNPIYPDRVINLAEVYQIFNVIEFWRPRRR